MEQIVHLGLESVEFIANLLNFSVSVRLGGSERLSVFVIDVALEATFIVKRELDLREDGLLDELLKVGLSLLKNVQTAGLILIGDKIELVLKLLGLSVDVLLDSLVAPLTGEESLASLEAADNGTLKVLEFILGADNGLKRFEGGLQHIVVELGKDFGNLRLKLSLVELGIGEVLDGLLHQRDRSGGRGLVSLEFGLVKLAGLEVLDLSLEGRDGLLVDLVDLGLEGGDGLIVDLVDGFLELLLGSLRTVDLTVDGSGEVDNGLVEVGLVDLLGKFSDDVGDLALEELVRRLEIRDLTGDLSHLGIVDVLVDLGVESGTQRGFKRADGVVQRGNVLVVISLGLKGSNGSVDAGDLLLEGSDLAVHLGGQIVNLLVYLLDVDFVVGTSGRKQGYSGEEQRCKFGEFDFHKVGIELRVN